MSIRFLLHTLCCACLLALPAWQASAASSQSKVILTAESAKMQLEQAERAYANAQYQEAYDLVMFLRPILAESTELHSQLFEALKEDDKSRVTANKEKNLTIQFAMLRDRANFLAGLICRKQGNYMEAAKHFVLVVQSQRSTGLGGKAYNALRQMGFSPELTLKDEV